MKRHERKTNIVTSTCPYTYLATRCNTQQSSASNIAPPPPAVETNATTSGTPRAGEEHADGTNGVKFTSYTGRKISGVWALANYFRARGHLLLFVVMLQQQSS